MNQQQELEQLKAKCHTLEEQLELVKNVVSHKSYNLGDRFYDTIVKQLNNSLKADYTFIGELTDENSIETISLFGNNQNLENIEYSLNYTPCENVVGKTVCSYADNVCGLFPKDLLLKQLKIKGYVGVPLFNSKKEPNGIIVSLYKDPIVDTAMAELLLYIFASQAGAEIEYNQAIRNLNASQKLISKQNDELKTLEEELQLTNSELFNTNELLIRNEQVISIQNNRLSNLINNLPDGILIEDYDGKITRVNKKFCKLFNIVLPPATLTGANMLQLLQNTSNLFVEPEELLTHTEKISVESVPVLNEEILLVNGTTIHRSFLPVQLHDDKSEKVWVYRDISLEKENANQLVESEKRLSSYIEHAPNGIFVTDEKGNFIDANPEAVRLSGYTRDALLSMNINSLLTSKNSEQKLLNFAKSKSNTPLNLELEVILKNNTDATWLLNATLISSNRLLGFVSDITIKKRDAKVNNAQMHLLDYSIDHRLNKVVKKVLDESELLSKSSFGFYHILSSNQKTSEYQVVSSNSLKQLHTSNKSVLHKRISELKIWKDCISKQNVIKADTDEPPYQSVKLQIGNTTLQHILIVPIIRNKKVVAILGLGNKKHKYKPGDVSIVQRFADLSWEIVSRKKTEEIVLEEQNRANNILEATNAGTWDWNIQTNNIIINSRWAEIMGYTIEELSPINIDVWTESVHPEDFKLSDKILQQHFKRELDYYDVEFRQKHKNGKWVWVHARGKVIEWTNDNKPLRMYGAHLDITERKKQEKKLEESVTKFKTLAEYTYDWEYWKNPNNEYIYLSPSCERITGYTKEEFFEDPKLLDSIIIQDSDKWQQHLEKAENQVACESPMELQIKTKQGRPRWINHVCRPVYNSNGDYIGNRGTNRDITLQKLSQMAMEQTQLRFRQLANLAFEGIVIHKRGVAQDVNRAFLNMTRYKVDEIFGKDLIQLLFQKKYQASVYEYLDSNHSGGIETELIRKGGDTIWVEINSKTITPDDVDTKVTSIRDITDQKRLQQKILQTSIQTEEQERKRIAQELHDGLGPVLSTIKLYTETYINSTNNEFKEKIKPQLLSGIDDALEQTSAISNNLSPHILNDFGLEIAIQKFVEKVKAISSIQVNFNYNYSLPLIKDIEITLYRITIELINNSLKHACPTEINIIFKGDSHEVQLEYRDNGIGFDFEVSKRSSRGMGLFNLTNRIKSLNGSINFTRLNKTGIRYDISIPNIPLEH